MSDSTYKKVKEYLVQKGYHAVPDETYDHIDEWLEWYQNDVEKFHHYKLYNGAVMTNQERYKLGMAKTVCEDWANLLLNEKVSIKAGKYSEQLSKILRYNNFSKQGNQLIEKAFALGTGAFVEYKDANDRVIIDYIRADMIYPLSWDNGDVTECAFGTSRMLDGKEVIYLQLHRFGKPRTEKMMSSITSRTFILMRRAEKRLILRRISKSWYQQEVQNPCFRLWHQIFATI